MQADQVDRDGLDRAPLRASWMLDGVRVDGQAVALGEVQRPVLAGQQLPIERPAGRGRANVGVRRAAVGGERERAAGAALLHRSAHAPSCGAQPLLV